MTCSVCATRGSSALYACCQHAQPVASPMPLPHAQRSLASASSCCLLLLPPSPVAAAIKATRIRSLHLCAIHTSAAPSLSLSLPLSLPLSLSQPKCCLWLSFFAHLQCPPRPDSQWQLAFVALTCVSRSLARSFFLSSLARLKRDTNCQRFCILCHISCHIYIYVYIYRCVCVCMYVYSAVCSFVCVKHNYILCAVTFGAAQWQPFLLLLLLSASLLLLLPLLLLLLFVICCAHTHTHAHLCMYFPNWSGRQAHNSLGASA